jgi:DNA-binding FadR family transcriptional regulator
MSTALAEMRRHTLHHSDGRQADQQFHAALLAASGNPYLMSLTKGVTAAVDGLTLYKLRLHKVERDPVPDHERVFEAIRARDAAAARKAMVNLIGLAIRDMPPEQRPSHARKAVG